MNSQIVIQDIYDYPQLNQVSLLILRESSRSASISRIIVKRIWNIVVILRLKRYLPYQISVTYLILNLRLIKVGLQSPIRATLYTISSSTNNWVVYTNLIIANKAYKEVQQRINKRVYLVKLDFQLSLREIGQLLSTNIEFKYKG